MLLRKYEMPWRRAYEAYAGLAWTLAFVFFVFITVRSDVPWPLTAGLALLCVMLAFHRSGQALGVLTVRASCCRAMTFITPKRCASSVPIRASLPRLRFEWSRAFPEALRAGQGSTFATSWYPLGCFDSWVTRSIRSRATRWARLYPRRRSERALPYRPLVNFEGGTCIAVPPVRQRRRTLGLDFPGRLPRRRRHHPRSQNSKRLKRCRRRCLRGRA